MRFLKVLFISTSLAAIAASPALSDPAYYVGADYQYISASLKSPYDQVLPKSLSNGADVHVGVGFAQNFAVELGYMQSESDRNILPATPVNTKLTISGPTLDALAYYPIVGNFYGVGSLGASYLTGKARLSSAALGAVSASESEFGYRGGLGFEFRFQKKFGVRAMVRYQSADFDDVAKHAIVGTVGLNFYF